MRRYLFKKANYLLPKVKIITETYHSIRLKVGNYEVVLKYQNHKLRAICSCKAGALQTPCSHILSAITYLVKMKNGKKTNQKTKRNIKAISEF